MVQLTVVKKGAAEPIPVGKYPFRIGRAPDDDLRLESPGVWAHHCTLEWRWPDGVYLVAHREALTVVNERTVREIRLRNGDQIQLGGVRLILTVRPAVQRGFRLREALVWVGLGLVTLAEVLLMWRILP